MPYDPGLAARLADLVDNRTGMEEKKMFGGIGWMLNGNMCTGVYKDWLIIRVGEEAALKVLKEKHIKPMDITGKPMRGWAMVAPKGYESDNNLERFVNMAADFVKKLPVK